LIPKAVVLVAAPVGAAAAAAVLEDGETDEEEAFGVVGLASEVVVVVPLPEPGREVLPELGPVAAGRATA